MSRFARFGWFLSLAALTAPLLIHGQTTGPIIGRHIPPGISAGELLVGELNCVACHKATESTTTRISPRTAPLLENVGNRVSPQELRAWISDPHSVQPGTTMPQLLHSLPETERSETVENLVHFLQSLKSEPAKSGHTYDELKVAEGAAIYHQVGCVACHQPFAAANTFNPLASGEFNPATFTPTSAPLGNLARKYSVQELAAFLRDPLKVRPSGRMPSLNLNERESVSVATFLLREQGASNPGSAPARLAGLRYDYFEGVGEGPDFNALKPKSSGVAELPSVKPREREGDYALRFRGYISIARAGKYTFFTKSDDGSRLFINDKRVVDNWGMHGEEEKRGEIELPVGEHPIQIQFYQGYGGDALVVSYSGPGISKREIPASLYTHEGKPMLPIGTADFTLDSTRVEKGRALFAKLGCASCHTGNGLPNPEPSSRSFADLGRSLDAGCLAPQPSGRSANYYLSDNQRTAIRDVLRDPNKLAEPLNDSLRVARSMASLNCYACHSRDAVGGGDQSRLDYFVALGEAELGDEGRIPPHLTKVGGKLKREWLQEVLANGAKARPYMAVRMPRFGDQHIGHLPQLLETVDAQPNPHVEADASQRDAKLGRRLVGTTGLSCIACHTFDKYASLGIPAVDLTQMTRRLKFDWFQRYMIDPPSLRPGTRMPSFWPGGEAVNKDILDGKTEAQLQALWAYLEQGPAGDPPDGLVQGRREIIADKEPTFYRNFIAGGGTRAIGVGYPEKVNLAFDANNLGLAMIWQGPFIDSARHSSGRGEGFEPPLGFNVLRMKGPSIAKLDSAQTIWPEQVRGDANYKFLGYVLDAKRRPSFRYRAHGAVVLEGFEPIAGDVDASFVRRVTITELPGGNLHFLLGSGARVENGQEGVFLIDRKLNLTVRGANAVTRQINGRTEVLVPLPAAGSAKFEVQMTW